MHRSNKDEERRRWRGMPHGKQDSRPRIWMVCLKFDQGEIHMLASACSEECPGMLVQTK
jgi:hypothetical protein